MNALPPRSKHPDTLFPYASLFRCRVLAVRTRGIEQRARDQILELLTAQADDRSVLLVFAGDATVRLEVEALHCRSEEHTSELQSLMRSSYAVFCLKKTISI